MPSAGRAIGWELVAKNRRGLAALGAYVALLAAVRFIVPDAGARIHVDSGEAFAAVVVVPMTASFLYLLGVFTFGFAGDLAARESIYPRRMFTLPVSASALAGWPMLIGAIAMAVLWAATRTLAIWPRELEAPVIWPGMLAVVLLGMTQALTWMPYGVRGMRVVMAILCLTIVDAAVLVSIAFKASEPFMIALLAPFIPAAYAIARYGVSRARRGDTPEWSLSVPGEGSRRRPRRPFAGAAQAQDWIEWKRSGRSLPLLVATVAPCELALLFLLGSSPPLVELTLVGVSLTPLYLAAFAAATVRKSTPDGGDAYGLSTFTATRPLTTASIVSSKLRTSLRSAIAAWIIVAVMVPLFLDLSGTMPLVTDRWVSLREGIGSLRAGVLVALALGLLVLMTWKQLVQGLYIGLSGREWIVKSSVFVQLVVVFVVLFALSRALADPALIGIAWDLSRWALGMLVLLKTIAAAVVATRLQRSGLLSDRALIASVALWCAAVFGLYAVLSWFLSTPALFPRYVLMLVAILVIPLTRLSAAPLALAWNRHR